MRLLIGAAYIQGRLLFEEIRYFQKSEYKMSQSFNIVLRCGLEFTRLEFWLLPVKLATLNSGFQFTFLSSL